MALAQVGQVGTPATPAADGTGSGSITGAWGAGQNRSGSNLLLAAVTAGAATSTTAIAGPGGTWSKVGEAVDAGGAHRVAWFSAVAAGADAAPTFTSTFVGGTTRFVAALYELAGQDVTTAVQTSGTATTAASASLTVTTAASVARAGCYALTAWHLFLAAAGTPAWTPGSGWTGQADDGATSLRNHQAFDVRANPATGAALSELGTWATSGILTGMIIVVQPSNLAAAPLLAGQAIKRASTY